MEVSDARQLKALEEENTKLKKLLAESMMDVSTLREMLGKKTSEARLEEECRELGHGREGLFAAPRLRPGGHSSACLPLSVEAAGRSRAAWETEGTGVTTPTLRLSPPAPFAEARGHRGQPEEALSALPREAADGEQARGRKRALGTRASMAIPQDPNQRWSLDFVSDTLADGSRFRNPVRHQRLQPGMSGHSG